MLITCIFLFLFILLLSRDSRAENIASQCGDDAELALAVAKKCCDRFSANQGRFSHARVSYSSDEDSYGDDGESSDNSDEGSIGAVNNLGGLGPVQSDVWPPVPKFHFASHEHCPPLPQALLPPAPACDCYRHELQECGITGRFASLLKKELAIALEDSKLSRDGNNLRRKLCYRQIAKGLGHTFRTPLPTCIVFHVRSLYPEVNGKYMGFRES